MECPACQHGNRERARFCEECGQKLERLCPHCQEPVQSSSKYCDGCGQDLSKPAKSSGATGPLDHPQPPKGERRQATVVFSDLSGYTAMNEKLDPEEVEVIMSRIKVEAVKIVESHGGIVNQFVGDEVLALFGIPTAHEDDPRGAVRAALEMHEMACGVSGEVEEKIGRALRLHTGINTGLIVTNLRDARDGSFGITGDTVNTGARLKALAEDDQILISPETRRRVAPFFELEALPPETLKGKDATFTPYRIVGETAVETRFEASERRGLSRYVGRERELEMLWECFHQAEQGRGQVVSVVGEAGLGKTRLIYELRTALDLSQVNQVRGRCAATGESMSYLPFVDLFQRWFRIRDTDPPAQMLDKARSGALALEPALEEHLPALLHLLSIPGEDSLPPGMASEAIQRKVQAALKACLLAGCREQPLVMVFEDLHWVDGSSETMIQQYIEALPAQRALLLLSFRPEYRPPWGHYSHLTPLVLKPLGEENTGAIVASALNVERLPEGLAPVVHARTEGNPFFSEEVALSLEEQGLVRRDNGSAVLTRPVEDISFPDTVQAVVRARIDRLPEASRDTLRLASVVGREFTEGLVTKLAESGGAVSAQLGELRTLELILEKRSQPELEFMFKHAITHQVAYESLLLARRKTLHRLVGLGIEELYADRLAEFHEMLAHHFDQGEVWDKAVEYLVKAGMKSRMNHAIQTSLQFFERAGQVREQHKPEVPWKTCYDCANEKAIILGELGQWSYAAEELESAVAIASRQGETGLQIIAMLAQASAAMFGHDFDTAKFVLTKVETLASDNPDSRLGAAAIRCLLCLFEGNEDPDFSIFTSFTQLIAQAPNSPFASSARVVNSMYLRWQGNFKASADSVAPLLNKFKETQPINRYLAGLFFYGLAMGEQGRYQEAIQVLWKGREFGLSTGERYSTPKVINSLGWACHELCLFDQAIEYNNEALEAVRELLGPGTSNLLEIEAQTLVNLGENYFLKREYKKAQEFFYTLYENAKKPEYFWNRVRWKVRLLVAMGELWLERKDIAKAKGYLDEALEIKWLTQLPFKKYQVRAGRLQGNIFVAQDKDKEAESELKKALKLAKELGNPTQLWRTAQALGNLYAKQGKAKLAATQYKAALKVVQGMADGLTDPELKDGFLNAEPIREVFAQAEAD